MRHDLELDRLLPPGGALAGRLFSRLIGTSHDDPPLEPGTLVGGWCVGVLLGRGGSSMVYLADRADGEFEQQVALKIVRPNQSLTENFRRERQILAELRHPAIAQLIDGGQMESGRLWFAMEPVFGERIDHYVRSRRLPLDERLALFDAACEAVAYAHSRLLVHRDIKPGNLLVDELGRPRLLDFGIAASSDVDGAASDRAMTPTYASPEQRYGGAITTASDVYQLGLLLRTLIMPQGEPCETLPHKIRTIIETELGAIIARATEEAPADRYPTVAALRSDLAALRQRRPISMIGGFRYTTARFLERHALSSAIAAAGVAALILTGWIDAHRVKIERDQAQAAEVRAKATSDFLVGLFSVSDPGENRGEKLTANQILARGAEQLKGDPKKDPTQMAAVALEIGRVYMELGEFARADDILSSAIATAQSTLMPGAPARVHLLTLRGKARYFHGEYAAAEHDFAAARSELALMSDPVEREAAEGTLGTQEAQLARRLGHTDDALAKQTEAIDLLLRSRAPDDPLLGLAWNNMGLIARDRGDYAAAETAYAHAISVNSERYGELHPRTLDPISNLAEVLVFQDEQARAEPLLLKVIDGRRKLQDGPSLKLSTALDLLSQIRLDQSRNEEAKTLAMEADDGYSKALGIDHNYRSFALIHLGNAQLGLGDGEGALQSFHQALQLRQLAFGEEHPDVANAWFNLGLAQMRLGDLTASEQALRASLGIRERALPSGHIMVARTRISLIDMLLRSRRIDDATQELERLAAEFQASDADTDEDRRQMADLYVRIDQIASE